MKRINLKLKNDKNKDKFFKKLKEKIFEDFKIKLLCFALAVATFVIISFIQKSEKVFSCPLTVKGLKENFIISTPIPETVKVIVKDKQTNLDKIVESDFKIKLDLSNIESPNTYTLKLNWEVPKSMQSIFNSLLFSSIELNPDKIVLTIENLTEKNVPIIINSKGSPPKGYTVKKRTVDALSVRIQGPEKIINNIKYIETEKINIEGETESFKRIINLISPSPLIKFVDRNKVEASFEIIKNLEIISYKFDNISIHNLNSNFKIELYNNYFIVTVSGLKEDIVTLTKDNIIISIDCAKVYYPGEYSFRIDVSLPKNINLVSINPAVLKANIKLKN